MRIPDFFIVGAPKCGTSMLREFLGRHPGVFLPALEPHHFCEDLPGRHRFDREEYMKLFAAAPPATLVGEKSSAYLFSEVALRKIIDTNPDAKIIALLRNPIDAAYSYHAQRLSNLQEDEEDFEKAWNLQEERKKGHHVPKHCKEPRLLQYREVFAFSGQVARLMETVPKTQCGVLVLEEALAQQRFTYVSLLHFLGLKDDGRTAFPRVNTSKLLRSRKVAEWHWVARRALKEYYRPLMPLVHATGLYPERIIRRWNVEQRARRALSEPFRRQLATEFISDVRKLEELLGRRLDCWNDFAVGRPC